MANNSDRGLGRRRQIGPAERKAYKNIAEGEAQLLTASSKGMWSEWAVCSS